MNETIVRNIASRYNKLIDERNELNYIIAHVRAKLQFAEMELRRDNK